MTPRRVYLLYRHAPTPVTISQVAAPLAHLARQGVATSVLLFESLLERFGPGATQTVASLRRAVQGPNPGKVERVLSLPRRWHPSRDVHQLVRRLRGLRRNGSSLPVQCRSHEACRVAAQAREELDCVKIIYECRGLRHAEYLYEHGCDSAAAAPPEVRRRAEALFEEERRAAGEADVVVCVSNAMRSWVSTHFGVPEDRTVVLPSCVDSGLYPTDTAHRERLRETFSLTDRFVVVFCGSMQAWHAPNLCARIFNALTDLVPSAHLLVVTTEPDRLREVLRSAGVQAKTMTCVTAKPAEVPDYLVAADVGLLLREPSPLNEVSSPIKFAEYLASGTPVIITEKVGDYSEWTKKESLGCVLSQPMDKRRLTGELQELLSSYQSDPGGQRAHCREVARSRLSWEACLPALAEAYQRLELEAVDL